MRTVTRTATRIAAAALLLAAGLASAADDQTLLGVAKTPDSIYYKNFGMVDGIYTADRPKPKNINVSPVLITSNIGTACYSSAGQVEARAWRGPLNVTLSGDDVIGIPKPVRVVASIGFTWRWVMAPASCPSLPIYPRIPAWKLVVEQNGTLYRNVVFHPGTGGGSYDPNFIWPYVKNAETYFDNMFYLAQLPTGPQFDPAKAFKLYYTEGGPTREGFQYYTPPTDWSGGIAFAGKQLIASFDDYRPSVQASFAPNPVVAGQQYTLSITAPNTTQVYFNCTGAFNGDGYKPGGNSTTSATAMPQYAGQTTCSFVGRSPRGDSDPIYRAHTITKPAPAPTVTAFYTPDPIVAGNQYTLITSTTNATSLTFSCVGAYVGSGSLPVGPDQRSTVIAYAQYKGTTTCRFTAVGEGGVSTTTASQTIQ
ncbi:MAG: hypothetical protein E6Q40_07620 [Cupriavidus sp.]|nr:MAG: hypothetical protein E6Q40_07620 [Cupriavidus sp.]